MSDTVRASLRRRLVILWVIALIAALVTGPVLVDSAAFGEGSGTEEVSDTAAPATDQEIAATWTEEATVEAASELSPDWSEYTFVFADGTTISGSNHVGEAGYTGDKNQADLGLSEWVHVSCSDSFPDGWGDKGAPVEGVDSSPLVSWSIDKYKGGQLDKTCSGDATPPDEGYVPGPS
jgi:hypothetical protein